MDPRTIQKDTGLTQAQFTECCAYVVANEVQQNVSEWIHIYNREVEALIDTSMHLGDEAWSVTPSFYRTLENHKERVLKLHGIYIWFRNSSGPIKLDEVIQEITYLLLTTQGTPYFLNQLNVLSFLKPKVDEIENQFHIFISQDASFKDAGSFASHANAAKYTEQMIRGNPGYLNNLCWMSTHYRVTVIDSKVGDQHHIEFAVRNHNGST